MQRGKRVQRLHSAFGPGGASLKPGQVWLLKALSSVILGLSALIVPFPDLVTPAGMVISLTWNGRAAFAVTVVCIVLWATEALPFAATALLAFVLLPLTGVYEGTVPQQFSALVADSLGSPVIVFLVGVMLLGAAVTRSGLSLQVIEWVWRRARGKPHHIVFGLLVASAFLGMWITPVATASTMVPAARKLLTRMNFPPGRSRFGKGVLLAIAWGSLIGSIATPAGTTSNPLVMGFMHNLADVDINFLDWMRLGVPIMVLVLPCAWLLLVWLFPPEMERYDWSPDADELDHTATASSSNQFRTLVFLAGAVVVWMAVPVGWFAWSALLLSVLLFMPRVGFLKWQEAERDVPWGTLLVVAAGIAIGSVAYRSGLARYLAHLLFANALVALSPFWRDAALSWATALLHALFCSNTVSGSIIAPLLISLAQDLGLNVWHTLAPAAYSVALAFLLVSETPTSLIAYEAGYFSARDYARAGLLLTFIAGLVVALVMRFV